MDHVVSLPDVPFQVPAQVVSRLVEGVAVTPVHEMLYGMCDSMGVRFTMGGTVVSHAHVLRPSGLLPALAWMSQDGGQRLLQADFGCVLRRASPSEVSLLGSSCSVPPVTGHIADITRALFFAHFAIEVFGMREGALVEVLPLVEILKPLFDSHLEQSTEGEVAWPQMSPQI